MMEARGVERMIGRSGHIWDPCPFGSHATGTWRVACGSKRKEKDPCVSPSQAFV